MATPVSDSLIDHSYIDGQWQIPTGTEMDENDETIANILDGTTAVTLGGTADLDINVQDPVNGNDPVTLDYFNANAGGGATQSINHYSGFILDTNVSQNVTITSVTTSRSVIVITGFLSSSDMFHAAFTSSTNVLLTRAASGTNVPYRFTVVEFAA